jgi:HSP20 family molecular chaperone IbpA
MCSHQQAMLAKQRPQTFSHQRAQNSNYVGGNSSLELRWWRDKAVSPPAELSEQREWMRLAVDLPGVQLKDLDVIINGVLTIEGFRRTMSVDGSVCVKQISRRYAIDADVVDLNAVAESQIRRPHYQSF